ncbi:ribosomal protein S18-alanine N-acetyltransferase [Phycicoccus avicenniae]|uniref:ribosomal protein S18-alanine N-acetyltransferase n=1 Tax=Phycicoccus avicenniae TaxID=2828860 RepID=UPI003D2A8824
MSTLDTVVVRDARWTDLSGLAALEVALFPDDAWSERSWWSELAGRPRRDYVVANAVPGADVPADLLGYGGLDHGGEVSDVMTVAVAPAARGLGLGRRLLDELERRAGGRGAEHVMLEVRADNEPATSLYASSGYAVVSRRRGYYDQGAVDALVMRKSLQQNGDR